MSPSTVQPGTLPSTGERCAVIMIESDLHEERPGFFRAFNAVSPDASSMCTVFGYCSAGHSFRTIRETVADVRRYDAVTPIYRNGRKIA